MDLNKFYNNIVPKVTSFCSAVVIIGAMFKLMNWEGGGAMLCAGLSVEAFCFILAVFEPPAKEEYSWERVFPVLRDPAQSASNLDFVQGEGVNVMSPLPNNNQVFNNNQVLNNNQGGVVSGGLSEQSYVVAGAVSSLGKDASVNDVEIIKTGLHDLAVNITEMLKSIEETRSLGNNLNSVNENVVRMNEVLERLDIIRRQLDSFGRIAEKTEKVCYNLNELSDNIGRMNLVYVNMLKTLKV